MATTTQTFGPYHLHEQLGVGGMATVHKATHESSGRVVALKRLLPQLAQDASAQKQFLREAEIAKALIHPNIVGVEEFGIAEKRQYLAMEYVEGRSVLQLLRRANEDQQPAPVGVAVWVLHEVLSALHFAMTGLDGEGNPFHIVHRDLSPSNVVITPSGVVKLIDFGVAKSLHGRYATNSGRIKGKLGYMPPEVLAGRKVDQRSDLYSTAIVTWELLTAQRLFRGSEKEQLASRVRKHERTPPSSINHWVPKELDALLAIALSEDPADRFASAGAMLTALAPILGSQSEGASDSALAKWCRQLDIGKDVLDHSQTNHNIPLADLLPPKKPGVLMPVTQLAIPGVRRFIETVNTVIDPAFDPDLRHKASLAAGSSEFPLGNAQKLEDTELDETELLLDDDDLLDVSFDETMPIENHTPKPTR